MGVATRTLMTIMLLLGMQAAAAQTDTARPRVVDVPEVRVTTERARVSMVNKLDDVTADAIYAAKKTEVIRMATTMANTATNNPRQVFATIPGLNIWESDAAGLQLGIGGRGLSPNRTSNFTTRQNGYDISADPLGYPESYYTPPMEALDRITLVRGAGSLRYGTQFGGMIDFVLRQPSRDVLGGRVRTSVGSFGFVGLFAELSGTTGALGWKSFYQYRRGDGWRPNSGFDVHTAHAALRIDASASVRITADYTHMSYLAQQPGGLTDRQFATDPSASFRSRNWFGVDWNLASVTVNAILDTCTSLRSMVFGNMSGRRALGNLERVTMADLGGERTLIDGAFANIGNETTLLHDCDPFGLPMTVLTGVRLFHGTTKQRQGNASAASDADFSFLRPDALEGSSYTFPNDNAAVFAEAVVHVTDDLRLVPGVRVEHVVTRADGAYRRTLKDLAGNVVSDTLIAEDRDRARTLVLFGLGATLTFGDVELYGNLAQNYRSITFSDLRIDNPNLVVDSNITDERGFTADLGIRGAVLPWCTADVSLFYLRYDDRIGQILRADQAPLFQPYRYRTNVADAYTAGIEAVADIDVHELLDLSVSWPAMHVLANISVLRGAYVGTDDPSIRGRDVELVPPYTIRLGWTGSWKGLGWSVLVATVGKHYTDATNAEISATAVSGAIPAYTVLDASVRYGIDAWTIELSCNNVLDAQYYTRRADAYPGPGIIPAEVRSITATVQWTL